MADITPTSITVMSGRVQEITLGADTTVLGQLLYWDSVTGSFLLATARGTTVQSIVYCMALEIALKDAVIRVALPGAAIKFDAILTQGLHYWLSPTAGRISNNYGTDLTPGDLVSFLGIAEDTQDLLFNVTNSRADLL